MRLPYLALLPLSLAITVHAQAQTLTEAVQQAIENHPEVQAGINGRMAADYQLKAARGAYLPSVDILAGIGREGTDNTTTRFNSNDNDHYRTLTRGESSIRLQQMIYDGSATREEVGRQTAIVNSRAYGLLATSERTALDAIQVYLEVLRREELVRLAEDNFKNHQRIYDQISLRSQRGVGSTADRDQADARLALARNNLITEQTNLADARVNYYSVIGSEPTDLSMPNSLNGLLPATLAEAKQQMVATNPSLRSAESDVAATESQYAAAKSAFLPRVDAEVSQSFDNNIDGIEGHSNEWQAMLRMRYNLYSGGSNKATLEARSYQINEALDIRNNALRQLNEELGLAWNALENARTQKPIAEDNVGFSKRVREAYQKQFGLGERTLLDLLDSENELFTAQRRLSDVNFIELMTQYRIKATMGDLLKSQGVVAPMASTAMSDVKTKVQLPGLN
ncbi:MULTISPECIES: TolC family outer membrane protein [Pseudomonas]|uniref:Channel protein TolC n=1 Tax=Pseudomonas kuykendallii TaxID=1007099 RepID=A0A2W5D8H0_9PSED|nr:MULTISPECIES: TolC family outer membrane protein [Pseudomonas]PZP26643.1 MAG: channel protein TolC [Pseudomonas kuykendallii]